MRRLALAPILVCALLSPSTALALGVGDIELQSALNQPLDAEIPLRGVSSENSDNIVVTLASEQAFREVGLERPFSLTRLQFDVSSRNGSHYIQVSSHEPITEPFLSFLIEVDSPDGNLLREYTVLLDPPVFASEEGGSSDDSGRDRQAASDSGEPSGAPDTMADTGDMSGRVADTDTRTGTDTESPSTSASQQREGQFDDTPMFLQIAREEEAAERHQAEQAAQQREQERQAAAAARDAAQSERTRATRSATRGTDSGEPASAPEDSRPQDYGPVQEGETLWDIAERLKRDEVTVQQMMLALLRYNPEAFEGDNINRLKQGYVLRVPEADEVRSIPAQQAIAQVRDQNGLWREWRDSLQQGGATRVAEAQDQQGGAGTAGGSADDAQRDQESGRDGGGSSAAGGDDSRLDIVGADEGGATSDETASATASSDSEAQKQLQLAREELASVRSEKEELSERVEQLESTVDKMEQLVTVREKQLAQLERQLAELREESGQSADTPTASTETGSADEEVAQDEEGDMMVADAGGNGGNGGATAPDGSDTSGTGADGGGAEQPGAGNGGSDTQTSASDQQREVVNPAEDTQQQERGWLDAALGFLASIGATISGAVSGLAGGGALSLPVIGGAGVAVLALVLLAVRRRRAAAVADEELMAPVAVGEHHADTEPVGLGADDSPAAATATASTAPADDNARASLMDEELDLSGLDVDPEAATSGGDVEQDDTLVEADTYLAYGLHQQAEDLLRLALEEYPDRLDYREKLLEALSAAGKSEEFVTAAEEFRSRLDDPSGSAWQRVSAMGRKLAPEHALFAAGAAAGGAAAASDTGADDDLEFDLGIDSEPAAPGEGGGSGDTLDSDLGAITGDAAAPESAAGSSESGDLTFDLSDLEDSTPAAEPASEPEGSPATAGGDEHGGLDFDLGDLGLDDDAQPPASGGGAADAGGSSSDSNEGGLDLDLGDLGIDDSADTTGSAGGSTESGSSAQDEGEIDLSDFGEMDLSAESGEKTNEATSSGADAGEIDLSFDLDESTATGSSELDDFGLGDSDLGEPATAGGDVSAPSAGGDEDPFAGLDDFGSSDSSGGGTDSGEFDLSSFEQGFGEPDSAQPEPAPTTGGSALAGGDDDLATMLDLAKAYIDMGDAESASHALQEVIAGGTEAQRSEARSLLETVQ